MSIAFIQKPVMKGPILALTKKVGYRGVDTHFHTEFSMDGTSKIESVLERCRNEHFGVAITDHNEIQGAVKAFKLKTTEFVVPGVELVCHEGTHLILYFHTIKELQHFFNKEIIPLKKKNPFFLPIDIKSLLQIARKYPCYTCTPHPFGPGVIGIMKRNNVTPAMVRQIDIVEGINGACLNSENKKAIEWAKIIKKGMSAGTDGHCTPQLAEVLCFAYAKDISTFLNSLKHGKSICIGKTENIFMEVIHTVEKFVTETSHERGKLIELYEDRYKTELEYFKEKFNHHDNLHHYMIHHGDLNKDDKEFMASHPHYKHIKNQQTKSKHHSIPKRKI